MPDTDIPTDLVRINQACERFNAEHPTFPPITYNSVNHLYELGKLTCYRRSGGWLFVSYAAVERVAMLRAAVSPTASSTELRSGNQA